MQYMLKKQTTKFNAYTPLLDDENNLNIPIGTFRSSIEGKLYQVNEKLVDMLGYDSTDELIFTINKTNLKECIYVNKENASKFVEEALKDGLWHSHECKFYRKDGDIIVVELSFRSVNLDSSVKYLEGFIKDITDYKNTEKELKLVKQNYSVLFNSSVDYIIIVGLDGTLLDINSAACEISGLPQEELIGKNVIELTFLFVDKFDEKMSRFKEILSQVLKGNAIKRRECSFIDKNGEIRYIEPFFTPILVDDKISAFCVICHDITECKNVEKDLKKSLAEKELLLKEIHHRVKNNLQIISSLLSLQTNYVENNETVNVLYESQNRINAMAKVHEMLYQSEDLTTINFSDYIEDIVIYLFQSYNAKGNIKPIINAEHIFLNIETAIPCGLIIGELVSNSLKYAFSVI